MKVKSFFLVSLLFLAACEKQFEPGANVKDSKISRTANGEVGYIPYADSASLAEFQNDKKIVSYNLARKLAIMELQTSGFKRDMNWNGSEISKMPVIIYGFDSKPKYYEFIVKDAEKKEIGTVSVHARRTKGGILHEIDGKVKDYTNLLSKSNGTGMKLFATYGGSLYLGIPSKAGDAPTVVIDPQTGLAVTGQTELSDSAILKLTSDSLRIYRAQNKLVIDTVTNPDVKDQLVKANSVPVETQIDSITQAMEKAHQERDVYWNAVAQSADSLLTLPDSAINEQTSKSFWSWVSGKYTDNPQYISKYSNDLYFQKGGWCGPWAMAWVYHANYGVNQYSYFENFTISLFGNKPMLPSGMFISMYMISQGRIIVNSGFQSNIAFAYSFVRSNAGPVVILTEWGSHWIVGYGTKGDGYWYWHNYYFAVNDNGHEFPNYTSQPHWHEAGWYMLYTTVFNPR
jgi:hypothetical protein